ncbi:MAG TPA: lamin tail domain-containing protein [Verrucomicrobiales bacterium]|nr:lamin tail domain-containing protein [Verrucomicrobiales bacterium]
MPIFASHGRATPTLLLLWLLVFCLRPVSAQDDPLLSLRISEFCASNNSVIADGNGDDSDWIEIYNSGDEPVSLQGVFLTDDASQLRQWSFPGGEIGSKQFLLVFASGHDEDGYRDPAGYSHTSFRLAAEGEYLALVAPDGVTIIHDYAPAYPPQFPAISYGLRHNNGELRYFSRPSPERANGSGETGVIPGAVFSHDRGFYDEAFSLEISTGVEDAIIYYTLNGDEPDPGTVFTGPVGAIYADPIEISTTTVVRTLAVKAGFIPSNTDTQTYLFLEDIIRQPRYPAGFPTQWGRDSEVPNVASDYEMDPEVAGLSQTWSVKEALLDIPTLSVVTPPDGLFTPDGTPGNGQGIYTNPKEVGDAWVRPASIEWILPDGSEGFQVDCSVQMQGNSSRRPFRMQKHAFRLDFDADYGPSKLRYPIIPENPVDEYNKIILRACFTDSWGLVTWSTPRYRPDDSQYLRDVWMKYTQIDMGHLSGRSTFAHLYLNGLYWGLYNPAERIDAAFLADHLGGTREDWDILHDFDELRAGDRLAWNLLHSQAAAAVTLADYYAILGRDPDGTLNPGLPVLLDPVNLCDYMLLHFHAHAEDWPSHNWYAARNRNARDGFRFFVWDQEIILDNPSHARYTATDKGPASLFHQLMDVEEFRILFADRTALHLAQGGALSTEACQTRYARLAALIDKAIVAESARWGDVASSTPYANRASKSLYTRDDDWVPERDEIIDEYIPSLRSITETRLEENDLLPSFGPPVLDPVGGLVQPGAEVQIRDPATSIFVPRTLFYTLDGSDPRMPGGEASSGALTASSPASATLAVDSPVLLRARLRSAQAWSALTEARFTTGLPPSPQTLALTEIHYHPSSVSPTEASAGFVSQNDFEFLELTNIGDATLDLSFLRPGSGFQLDFTQMADPLLPPGETVYLVQNPDAFHFRYADRGPLRVAGPFLEGTALSNDGERLVLRTGEGAVIADVRYTDADPWPSAADGEGPSLEIVDPRLEPLADRYSPANWRPSAAAGGSVGTTLSDPIAQWLAAQGGAGPLDDPDGDGQTQLAAFAFGLDLDPSAPSAVLKAGDDGRLVLTFTQRTATGSVAVAAQWTHDLQSWETLLPGSGEVAQDTEPAGHPDLQHVTLHWPKGLETRETYVRLRITWSPGP